MPRVYTKRKIGDVIANGAELVERIDNRLWKIKCRCGNVFISQPSETSGRCQKCGGEVRTKSITKHGESFVKNGRATRLYNIWLGVRTRCYNKKNAMYKHYGGRGVKMCHEWDSYMCFKEWALSNGYSDNLSLDRIDVNGNYEPSNCRWATQKEQMRNTRKNHFLTFRGETKTMVEWSEITGIKYHTLKNRINNYGWDVGRALGYGSK